MHYIALKVVKGDWEVKLAFCLFKYFPFGGLQRDFLRITKECLSRGHEVHVYTMAWEGEKEPGLTIHLIPCRGSQNHTQSRRFYKKLKPFLDDYDVVIGFNKMPGLDIYYAADTCYQAKARQQRSWLYRLTPRYRHLVAFEKAVFKSSTTKILLLSRKQEIDFKHYYQTPSECFYLLPPGISKDRVAPENRKDVRMQIRNEWDVEPNENLLLMVGSGFKTKGLDRSLIGLASLPNELKKRTKLFIIGKDNPDLFLKQAKQLKIRDQINFLGGRHDVSQLLLAADLLLHPAYNENTGTVLLEALASGLPVLTTDVCGYAPFIQEANAGQVLTSPFKQEMFNHAIEEMLLSKQRYHWSNNGIIFAKRADIYSLPQRAVDYIEKIADLP